LRDAVARVEDEGWTTCAVVWMTLKRHVQIENAVTQRRHVIFLLISFHDMDSPRDMDDEVVADSEDEDMLIERPLPSSGGPPFILYFLAAN
jgi:hypothetical protein